MCRGGPRTVVCSAQTAKNTLLGVKFIITGCGDDFVPCSNLPKLCKLRRPTTYSTRLFFFFLFIASFKVIPHWIILQTLIEWLLSSLPSTHQGRASSSTHLPLLPHTQIPLLSPEHPTSCRPTPPCPPQRPQLPHPSWTTTSSPLPLHRPPHQ